MYPVSAGMNTNVSLLLVDGQHSVMASASHNARAYTPYGAFARTDGLFTGFTGENRDPVTGCYHLGLGYRTYNPVLMRFHSADSLSPFGEGGINPYTYRDPVNSRDPSGHSPITVSSLTQRIMTATFGVFSVGKSLVGKPPSTRLEKLISRLAFGGGMLSIGGATAQAAGLTAATFVSNGGAVLAGTGHVLGLGKSLYEGRNQILSNMTGNLRSLIGMKAKGVAPVEVEGGFSQISPRPSAPPLSPEPRPSAPALFDSLGTPEGPGFRQSALVSDQDIALTVSGRRPSVSLNRLEEDPNYLANMRSRVRQLA